MGWRRQAIASGWSRARPQKSRALPRPSNCRTETRWQFARTFPTRAPLQLVANVIPAKWFIIVARGIMLKGVGITHLWQELGVMLVMTVLLLTLATRSFKPRLA